MTGQLTANLAIIFAILGIVGFAIFKIRKSARSEQHLRELEEQTKRTDIATGEIVKERQPGETEKDLENGQF